MSIVSVRRLRVRAGLMAAVTVIVTGVLPGQNSEAAEGDVIALSQAVAFGAVVRDGKPASGATVQALIWPRTEALAALADGAPVPTKPLPPAKTDSSGRFLVNLDGSSLPASYRDAKGRSQVELQVSDGTGRVSWSFTATPSMSGWTSVAQQDAGTSAPESVVVDLGAASSVCQLAPNATEALASGTMSAKSATASSTTDATIVVPDVPRPPGPCVYVAAGYLYNRAEPFMHVYPGRNSPATVLQSLGVDHSLGIAVGSSTGWVGGSAGGTATISLQASGSKTLTYNATAFNALNFRDYRNVCGWTHRQATSVYAVLQRIDTAAEPDFRYCSNAPGTTYTKARGTNVTFRAEVNVGPVSVDAHSGWNSSSSVTWHVTGPTQLCGSSTLGWASASEAEANALS
jgi:hypothetical protein